VTLENGRDRERLPNSRSPGCLRNAYSRLTLT
jgi:hypothetical protein